MAAVQRTPTPVDIRSRKAFIESMEEELKRVQDHLDRRQWRYRNGSTASMSSVDPVAKKQARPGQWYTLARSNPASRKKRDDGGGEEVDEPFVRVSSAQDRVVRTASLVDSSSCSSKSPTPEPTDLITRVRSPVLPLQNLQDAHFSSPSPSNQGRSLTQGMLSSPHHRKSSPSFLYSSSLPPASTITRPSFDETPLLVKEMPFGLMQSRLQQVPSDNAMPSYEDEEDEEEDETHREVIMPSAFGDLYLEVETKGIQRLEREEGDEVEVEEEEDTGSSHSVEDTMQHITPPLESARLNRKDEDDEGIGKSSLTIQETSKMIDDNSAAYEFERYQRMQSLKEEKARSEMMRIIDDLKEKLREKDKGMVLLQERMHVEVKVREERIKKVLRQHARLEKEKWDLLKKAREAAERSVNLRTKLEMNETQLRSSVVELDRVNDELSSVKAANKSLRLIISDLRNKMTVVEATTQTEDSSPTSPPPVMPLSNAQTQTSDSGEGLSASGGTDFEDWEDMLSMNSSQCDSRDVTPVNTPKFERGKTRRSMKKLLNRLRRNGSTGKHHSTSSLTKASTATTSLDNLQLSQSSFTSPPTLSRSSGSMSSSSNRMSSVSLQESADPYRVLEEFKSVPFNQWNTRALVAWMEVVVGMPHYISNVRQHVTSGHAMLALGNSDLEKKLGIPNPLHRRRLRLGIEERRTNSPSLLRPPHISEIDHNWVAYTWAVECGLPHISAALYNGMVNGKVLNSLAKEDLRKCLKMGRKTEQLSFLSGVELLRMHDFDREAIKSHRQATNNPLYWTNNDVCEWLRKTDLETYADNVIASGVHGALLFLERGNFTSEHLASIIRIPPKSSLRKQLATHLAKLFSTEDIASLTDEEEIEPHPQAPQPIKQGTVSPTNDGSPHPMRRMGLPHASSNPDVSDAEDTPFERHTRDRISLRESLLRSVPMPPERNHIRPLSQVCSTTTV